MSKELEDVVRVISQTLERDVSVYDESFLAKSIEKRVKSTLSETPSAYLRRVREDRSEAEAFFRSLIITYSEFFRGRLTFALLEQIILPKLIEEKASSGRSEIRIWSAGCAAGQEAYSVAILLDELVAGRGNEVSFRIFGTDISAHDVESAGKGVYGAQSMRNVTLKHVEGYFTRQGAAYVISDRLRERINFSRHDLLDDLFECPPESIFGDFDLVMCCNLLIYYRPDLRRMMIAKLSGCLAHNGYLITGEAERAIVEGIDLFRMVAAPAPIFQRINQGRRP